MAVTAGSDAQLLERERELAALVGGLDRVASGQCGALAVIAGEAGIGKSALLAVARERAADRGFDVRSALGGELEHAVAFGVVQQLFGDDERPDADARPPSAELLHERLRDLHRRLAKAARERPLLVAIDDAQWADSESLRWLAYVARRLDNVPALLLCATRMPEPDELVSARLYAPDVVALRPAPLSRETSHAVVRAGRGADAAPVFCDACHDASGGNPFYLRELVRETQALGIAPVAGSTERLRRLTTDAIAASTLLRLRRLGPSAVELARAVAILGIGGEVRDAAAVARLTVAEGQLLVDTLAAAGILAAGRPLDFAHPVIRTTVYSDIAPGSRATLHLAAARALDARGAPDDAIASQLMRAEPAGEPWAARALHESARRAYVRGAIRAARRLAARALAEPPPPGSRAQVLGLLARAQMLTGDAASQGHLKAAIAVEPDPQERRRLTLDLLELIESRHTGVIVDGEPTDNVRLIRELRAALTPADSDAIALLDAMMLVFDPDDRSSAAADESRRQLRALADAGAPLRGWPDAALAYTSLRVGDEPVTDVVARAERVLASLPALAESRPWRCAVEVLHDCDELDRSGEFIAAALADARSRGSELAVMFGSAWTAHAELKRGNLPSAAASARAGLGAAADWDEPSFCFTFLTAVLVTALVHQGLTGEAGAELDAGAKQFDTGAGVRDGLDAQLLWARGQLRLATDDGAGAAADMLALGEMLVGARLTNPAAWDWRAPAVHGLVRADETEQARTLAADNLERARRFGARGAIGDGLVASAAANPGPGAVALLEEAVGVLDGTPLRLARAQATVALGTALRQTKARTRARDVLRAGVDLAERCGAVPLAARAREELRIAGARPRRDALSGVDALTASERRVARLAADGMTNREIATTLFLSMKTVAFHLSNAYRKLDVPSRDRLAEALGARE